MTELDELGRACADLEPLYKHTLQHPGTRSGLFLPIPTSQ